MPGLKAERLARLHTQFLNAAERYPDLHFAAATDRGGNPDWPHVPAGDGDNHLGLWERLWREALNRPSGAPLMCVLHCWLRIENRIWHGAFVSGAPWPNEYDLQLHNRELTRGKDLFDRLARIAAGHFCPADTTTFGVSFPLHNNAADRWLETVAAMPFVTLDTSGVFLVKRVPGDVFTASARAIEDLSSLNPPAANSTASDATEGVDEFMAEQTTSTPEASREAILSRLQAAQRKAYLSCQFAETKAGKALEDQAAHKLLKEENIPTDQGELGELTDYALPSFDTWSRQLRRARSALGEQKYETRRGRAHGPSIVNRNQVS